MAGISAKLKHLFLTVFVTLCGGVLFASGGDGEKFNASEMINHHISDAHEWHFFTTESGPVAAYLPVILKTEEGVEMFSSSQFYHNIKEDHGHQYGVSDDGKYAMYHEHIYYAENGKLSFDEAGHPKNNSPQDFSITKNVVNSWLASIIMLIIFFKVAKFYKKGNRVPKGLVGLMEPLIIFVRDDIAKQNIGEKKYEKYLPYLLTVFFFIWISNLLGLLPAGANSTGHLGLTLVLATLTLLITVFSGNKNYWKHIFATPGVPVWLLPIMILVEILGVFSKPFALMVRLAANISAGHIVVLSLISIIFVTGSATASLGAIPMALFISVLELLVAFLQAFVFTLLSALFIGMAVEEEHH